MKKPDDPLAWVKFADEDLLDAQAALRAKAPRISSACFHSQQCAEKYLKALLISKAVAFPKIHDLIALNALCAKAGIFTGFSEMQLGDLSAHAVKTRYPGEEPTLEEAHEALAIAKIVRKFSRSYLGLK